MSKSKADSAEFERRISAVTKRIVECEPAIDIVQSVSAEYGVTTRQGWNYYTWALARLRKLAAQTDMAMLGKMLARHDLLRKHGFKEKDYRLVLDTDKEDASLLGLYPPKKIAPTNPAGDQEYGALSDEERMKRLLAVLKEAGVEIGES